MKWKESILSVDLNESKLNVRADNEQHFEIVPKLLVEPDQADFGTNGNVTSITRVIAASTGGAGYSFGIAMNSDLLILSSDMEKIQHSISFEAPIDFVLWRRSVLLVGLASSEIALLNPNTFEVTESRKVCPNMNGFGDRFFVDAFIHSNPKPTLIDLVAVGVDGTIYTSKNISLSTGSLDFTHDENLSIDIDCGTIQGSLQKCLPEGAQVLCATSPGRDFMFTGEMNGTVSVFSLDGYIIPNPLLSSLNVIEALELASNELHVTKLVHCEGLLFALLSNGRLEILLGEELIPTGCLKLPSSTYVVQDFELVISSADVIRMWVLFSNSRENDHFVGIFPAPTFELDFIARIPTHSEGFEGTTFRFPNSVSSFDEPSTFIEITPNGSTKVYEMTECSTDISLQNFLVRGMFGKAELLARKYGKDLDLVWKAKLKVKYAELLQSESDDKKEKLFREIASTVMLIQDSEFVCGFCTEKGFPRLEWVKELLGIGIKRVGECSGSENGIKLLQARKTLYTFEQVSPSLGINKWNEFSSESSSMFAQCLLFLQNLEFDKCEIVWLRHCHEFIPDVDLHNFAAFFKTLFMKKLDSPEAVSLFRTIFPYAVEKCESDVNARGSAAKIGALVALVRAQIRALERDKDWPEGAISFTKIIISAVSDDMETLQSDKDEAEESRIHRKLSVCSEIKTRLDKIVQSLRELGQLINSHSIRIPFEEYTTRPNVDSVNTMLRVLFSKEEVEVFVKEFLFPFATRYKLDRDEILRQHVEMIASDVPYFMTSGSIPFEERVVTLIDFIESPKTKLDCILIMAEEWPVPWFPLMDSAVKRCLEMNVNDNPSCRVLQKTIELIRIQVPFRCLLQKYRLTASKLTYAFSIRHTIKRMLKSKKENCFEDCLELIKHTGKCDESEVKYIKFWYELSETKLPVEDILGTHCCPKLAKTYLSRILYHFSLREIDESQDPELWERYTLCGKMLGNQLDDQKALEFFKLRDIIPNLCNDGIVHSMDYPFSALNLILENEHSRSASEIIKSCDKLSNITYSHAKDILVTAACYFCNPGMPGSALCKIWDILVHIVRRPGLCHESAFTPFAGVRVLHHLIAFAPSTSTERLAALHSFCRILLHSYDNEIIQPVAKHIEIILIFQDLRDHEIPLEAEFLSIYKEVWRECRKGIGPLLSEMEAFGEALLRFGDNDLYLRAFHGVQREYVNQAKHSYGQQKHAFLDAATKVESLQKRMSENIEEYQVKEANPRVINLVKSLEEAGLSMNAFALRQRDKAKLIRRLVDMNCFMLAAQTALVFDFRDQASWTSILKVFIAEGTVPELKNVLESLKRITELWVLPEFSIAWLKVAETYPNFKHMCPIPLDY